MLADQASQALRATCAAPLYFAPAVLGARAFLDGGLVANNPSAIALHEARALFPNRAVQCVVSLGTGRKAQPAAPASGRLKTPQWLATMKTLAKAATRTEDVHHLLTDTLPLSGIAYFRLNPPLDERLSLDETSPDKLMMLQRVGQQSVARGGCCADAMDALIRLLSPTTNGGGEGATSALSHTRSRATAGAPLPRSASLDAGCGA